MKPKTKVAEVEGRGAVVVVGKMRGNVSGA